MVSEGRLDNARVETGQQGLQEACQFTRVPTNDPPVKRCLRYREKERENVVWQETISLFSEEVSKPSPADSLRNIYRAQQERTPLTFVLPQRL